MMHQEYGRTGTEKQVGESAAHARWSVADVGARRMFLLLVVIASLALLIGCAGGAVPEAPAVPSPTATALSPTVTPAPTLSEVPGSGLVSPLATPVPTVVQGDPEVRSDSMTRDLWVPVVGDAMGVDGVDLEILSIEPASWPNSCLGLGQAGEMCLDVITPGYRIIVGVDGQEVEVRSDEQGTVVRVAAEKPDRERKVAILWNREGGIAGFCDTLTIDLGYGYVAERCKGEPKSVTGNLSGEEAQQVSNWISDLAPFADRAGDKAKADAMFVNLVVNGFGTVEASPEVKQAIQQFCADVYTSAWQ
ncbi:MAG: hypothetical protein U9R25_16910 [Chloroflexota bacterium]|nr:hypothetical protein [Chloroflexota bacterium]